MVLDVSPALRKPGDEFPFQVIQELPPQDVLGDTVSFDPVTVAGAFAMEGDNLLLHGEMQTVAHSRCANCLEPAQVKLTVPFRETLIRNGAPDDPEHFSFARSSVDLSEMTLSLIILALPMRILCRPDCTGFCDRCGKRKDQCACQKELDETRHPFAVLQQLLTKDEEV